MHHTTTVSSPAVPTMMRYHTPGDLEWGDGNMERFRRDRGLQRRRRLNRFSPTIFEPSGGLQDRSQQLQVGDPEVVETGDTYKLTFDLPAEVDRDGLDVSVSGRLLTVKARATHEDSSASTFGGWVTRSSRTESVSRSFVLPEGLSPSGATASLTPEGKAEVNFSKDVVAGAGAETAPTTTADSSPGAKAGAKDSAATEQLEPAGRVGVTTEGVKSPSFSTSAEYLSSLSGVAPPPGPAAKDADDVEGAPAAKPTPPAERPSRPARSASVFDTLDQEFGQFARAMWGEDTLRFPTQEEVEERAHAAREARAKRVVAMRRATMATAVSQKEDGSYLVRVSLPEDATREGINLVVTPKNTLRVSYASEGRRSLFKDVNLPKDADLTQISAKFEAEQEERAGESGENSVAVGAVSALEITVGKAAVPEPKRVNIE